MGWKCGGIGSGAAQNEIQGGTRGPVSHLGPSTAAARVRAEQLKLGLHIAVELGLHMAAVVEPHTALAAAHTVLALHWLQCTGRHILAAGPSVLD